MLGNSKGNKKRARAEEEDDEIADKTPKGVNKSPKNLHQWTTKWREVDKESVVALQTFLNEASRDNEIGQRISN